MEHTVAYLRRHLQEEYGESNSEALQRRGLRAMYSQSAKEIRGDVAGNTEEHLRCLRATVADNIPPLKMAPKPRDLRCSLHPSTLRISGRKHVSNPELKHFNPILFMFRVSGGGRTPVLLPEGRRHRHQAAHHNRAQEHPEADGRVERQVVTLCHTRCLGGILAYFFYFFLVFLAGAHRVLSLWPAFPVFGGVHNPKAPYDSKI